MKKPALVILAVVTLGALFIGGSASFKAQQAESLSTLASEEASLFAPADAMSIGPEDAPVTVVEWFDPGCETCRSFHPLVKQLLAENDGDIRLVLRYAPFHHGADMVSMILEASRRQDLYSETLEVLFDTQPQWASHHHPRPELVWDLLPQAGLDMDQLRADVADPAIRGIVDRDMADARRLGVRKTPTFFVNGKSLTRFGLIPLQTLVASELEAAR